MERLHGSDGTAQSLPLSWALTKSGGVGLAELLTNRVDRSGWYDISQSIVICSCAEVHTYSELWSCFFKFGFGPT